MDPAATFDVRVLVELYDTAAAHGRYEESVSELEHALQTAELAAADRAPDHLVAAALLHDVGHLILGDADVPITDAGHELTGARWLRRWFGPSVTAPVALHVAAKRRLCATDAGYIAGLSPASLHTLGLQGGPMTPDEVLRFDGTTNANAAVRLRRWDDRAKVEGARTRPFALWTDLLEPLARTG